MFNAAALAQLFSGKLDLATAFGLEQKTLTSRKDMEDALTAMAEAMGLSGPKVEVFYIAGAPAMMQGRKVRILAVMGDFPDEEIQQQLSS